MPLQLLLLSRLRLPLFETAAVLPAGGRCRREVPQQRCECEFVAKKGCFMVDSRKAGKLVNKKQRPPFTLSSRLVKHQRSSPQL